MPQMRDVMSGASVYGRPRSSASKNRGGSKMRNAMVSTFPALIRTVIAPSPSTRASALTRIVRLRRSFPFMSIAFFAERIGIGVERAVELRQLALAQAEFLDVLGEAGGIGALLRTEAAVATAVVARAQAAAPGMGDGPQAGRSVRDHHAHLTAEFAFETDAMGRN